MILIFIIVLISLISYYIWTYRHPYSWQKYKGNKKVLTAILLLLLVFAFANMEHIADIYNKIIDFILKGLHL